MKLRNAFTAAGKWYKANLHTHTTTSDGRASPAETAELYRKAGYDVLALTDHNATNDVSGMSRKGFLVVSGMEYHPQCPGITDGRPHHFVAIGVPHGFGFRDTYPKDGNRCIRRVKAAGGESFLAHPLWCGHRFDQYAYLRGYVGMEIYNATCDRIGRSASDGDYAQLLDDGRMLGALAVDDCHGAADRFKGWTWLKMRSLTVASVLTALRTGTYYASTGPKIHDFRVEKGRISVRCSPVEFIYLSAQTHNGARKMADSGKAVTRAACDIPKAWRYVRAAVVDHRGRKAWTTPIVLK